MARKVAPVFPGRQERSQRAADLSWMALGVDTSMTSLAVVGIGFDGILKKRVGPFYAETRWMPDDDYFKRLADAAHSPNLISVVTAKVHSIKLERTFIAIEEPFFYGAVKKQQSSFVKQQAEVCGSFKGGLARWGYVNMFEINNSQWRAAVRRDGQTIRKGPEGKWDVKAWAINSFGLPDLPDLVKSKSGAKIPRPESGYGAKAKAVQPNDIYDAAACCAWMVDELEKLDLI